jgi:hypothetical protein
VDDGWVHGVKPEHAAGGVLRESHPLPYGHLLPDCRFDEQPLQVSIHDLQDDFKLARLGTSAKTKDEIGMEIGSVENGRHKSISKSIAIKS